MNFTIQLKPGHGASVQITGLGRVLESEAVACKTSRRFTGAQLSELRRSSMFSIEEVVEKPKKKRESPNREVKTNG